MWQMPALQNVQVTSRELGLCLQLLHPWTQPALDWKRLGKTGSETFQSLLCAEYHTEPALCGLVWAHSAVALESHNLDFPPVPLLVLFCHLIPRSAAWLGL